MRDDQVLVMGGRGFIGRYVVRKLLQHDVPVRVMTRNPAQARPLFDQRVDIVQADLTDTNSLEHAVKSCSSLINAAGCYEFGPSSRKRLEASNVEGIRNLITIWKTHAGKNGRLVHLSTAGIWEQADNGTLRHPDIPSYANYKQTKYAGEQLVFAAAREGLNAVVVNPTCPIGSGDETPTPTGRMIYDFMQGKFPVSSRTGVNLIHVEDLAEGIIQAWKHAPGPGPYVLGDQNLWLDELLALLSPMVDRPVPRWRASQPLIRLAGAAGEQLDRLFPGFCQKTQLCSETSWLAGRAQFFELEQVYQELKWRPHRGVPAGLEAAVHWYQSENKIPPDLAPVIKTNSTSSVITNTAP